MHRIDPLFRADKVVVHPRARNFVFAGSAGVNLTGVSTRYPWARSPDGGTTWANLYDRARRFPCCSRADA